jgi:uncharacterized protein (DUF1778 family)
VVDLLPHCPYIDRTASKEVIISSSKTERIEVRVSEREQEVLRQAAETQHMTVSAFILSTVVPRAQEVVHRSHDIRMSAGAHEQFLAELDRPAESVPALLDLFSRPRRIQFGES